MANVFKFVSDKMFTWRIRSMINDIHNSKYGRYISAWYNPDTKEIGIEFINGKRIVGHIDSKTGERVKNIIMGIAIAVSKRQRFMFEAKMASILAAVEYIGLSPFELAGILLSGVTPVAIAMGVILALSYAFVHAVNNKDVNNLKEVLNSEEFDSNKLETLGRSVVYGE